MRIVFDVPGNPMPWKRAGRAGKRTFTPPKMAAYKKVLADYMLQARPFDWNQHARYRVGIVVTRDTAHAVDLDNIQKMLGDAGNGVLWQDDARIDAWDVTRARTSMTPSLLVVVEAVDRVTLDTRVAALQALAVSRRPI